MLFFNASGEERDEKEKPPTTILLAGFLFKGQWLLMSISMVEEKIEDGERQFSMDRYTVYSIGDGVVDAEPELVCSPHRIYIYVCV